MNNLLTKKESMSMALNALSAAEKQLLVLIAAAARDNGVSVDKPLEIHATGIEYFDLCLASETLFGRFFDWHSHNKDGVLQYHVSRWLSEVVTPHGSEMVVLYLSPSTIELLPELKHI